MVLMEKFTERRDQNIPETNYRKYLVSSKENTFQQFLQISVHKEVKSTKRRTF